MKKIGLLMLALVLALGTMGAVLARSTETLWISGDVETGSLQVAFTGIDAYWSPEDVNVSVEYDNAGGDGEFDLDIASITIKNAYPSAVCFIELGIKNTGTTPLHIAEVIFTVDGSSELEVWLRVDPTSTTLCPGEVTPIIIGVHVTDDALEETSYYFKVEVVAEQGLEY